MNEFAKDALGFLLGCLGVAAVVFAFSAGIALLVHSGQAQTCAAAGGQWVATDKVVSVAGDSGVDRSRECQK